MKPAIPNAAAQRDRRTAGTMDRCELDILDVAVPGRPHRTFTLAEANRSLVPMRRVVEDEVSAYKRAVELQQVADSAQLGPDYGQRRLAEAQLAETVEQLQEFLWELDELGVELRDWQAGRIDFPARVRGRQVRLSWQLGDAEVRCWHEVHPACEDLQPIETFPAHPAETIG